MLRALTLVSIVMLFACPDASATSRENRKRLTTLEKQFTMMQVWHRSAKSESTSASRDWRGRLKIDDLEQWAYTPAVNQRVPELFESARHADDIQAMKALDDASQLIDGASARARDIGYYWRSPSVSWRSRWATFAAANELPSEPTDAPLLAAEQKVRGFLDSGDFVSATSAGAHLDSALESAIRSAGVARAAAADNSNLRFVARSTPCPEGSGGTAAKAGIARAPSPEDYYPAASKRLGEQGAIILRAHIAPTSCATEFALVVSSGYPALDKAALKVAEDSTYAAATENGQGIEGYLTFKVKFTIAP